MFYHFYLIKNQNYMTIESFIYDDYYLIGPVIKIKQYKHP